MFSRTYVFVASMGNARGLGWVKFLKITSSPSLLGQKVEFRLLPALYAAKLVEDKKFKAPPLLPVAVAIWTRKWQQRLSF